jgi:hypothetical protein
VEDTPVETARLGFVEWSEEAGLSASRSISEATAKRFLDGASEAERQLLPMAAGLAVGDVDGDGWMDLFVLRGDKGCALLQNQRDGTFADVTDDFGLTADALASGALFADFDGDGRDDLLVGGIGDVHVELWRNVDGKSFEDVSKRSRLSSTAKVLSVAAGDPDGDGDLDVVLARPYAELTDGTRTEAYWVNDGTARFSEVSGAPPYPNATSDDGDAGVPLEVAIAPSFADLNGDGAPDIAAVQDFGLSQALTNAEVDAGVVSFEPVKGDPTSAPFARGGALGDYDNDGDLDWFVSGVTDTNLPQFADGDGNHLYQNDGDGAFTDVTKKAGIADGSFGWGSCFADFDNDGYLDLFQVNGWGTLAEGPDAGALRHDASRLFQNQRDGKFHDVASAVGIDDTAEGRAVACFDYDHDGDVDIVVTNAEGDLTLWGNTLNPWFYSEANYMCVLLNEEQPTQTVVGTRVSITTSESTQTRQILLGSYVSQASRELHFGIGSQEQIDRIDIEWADGDVGTVTNWNADNCLIGTHLVKGQ